MIATYPDNREYPYYTTNDFRWGNNSYTFCRNCTATNCRGCSGYRTFGGYDPLPVVPTTQRRGWLTRLVWKYGKSHRVAIEPPPAQRVPERVLELPIVAAAIRRMVFGPSPLQRRRAKRRAFVHALAH